MRKNCKWYVGTYHLQFLNNLDFIITAYKLWVNVSLQWNILNKFHYEILLSNVAWKFVESTPS